ncbi:hypothetical protein CDAR_389681 [Caerostris darwini]|uniref:Uncharacterized protein n=1 Tax=Caerostris darwini TaxID=1538125 RepID=A0AAV4P478_9ARAC|nr:hypothetical protein CDAR_389681 [Caerostris darwini]
MLYGLNEKKLHLVPAHCKRFQNQRGAPIPDPAHPWGWEGAEQTRMMKSGMSEECNSPAGPREISVYFIEAAAFAGVEIPPRHVETFEVSFDIKSHKKREIKE